MDEFERPVGGGLDTTLERQDQIITRRQLIALGFNDFAITRRVRRGHWLRVLPGIYLLATGPLSNEQRRIAAGFYAGAGAQLTGQSALHWHGFRYVPATDRVHVLVPHETRRRSIGFVVVHRTHELDPNARQTEHYQVASPGRAVVDACRATSDVRTVRAIMAEAVQSRFTSVNGLDKELRRAGRSRTAVARRVLHELVEGVRSSPEAELRDITRSSSVVPNVLWNPRLVTPDGQPLPTPDGWIPEAGIALEVDSRTHHFDADDWARTLRRHNLLARCGIVVLHFTPKEIREEPARVLRIIERTYVSRRSSNPAVVVTVGAPL